LVKSKGKVSYSRELITRLAQQLHVIHEGIKDALDDAPIEAVLQIEPALDAGVADKAIAAWCENLLDMYRVWATKRGMQISDGGKIRMLLMISGFGAYRTLEAESGLHVLESEDETSARVVARVRVAAAPTENLAPAASIDAAVRVLNSVPRSGIVIRRYRGGSSPLVRDAKRGWRSGKLEAVLQGNFDLIGSV
jgi:ATP-dependent Clp protease ATP-binding subunit ClpC